MDTFLNYPAKTPYSNHLHYVGITCFTQNFLLYLVTREILRAVQITKLLIIQIPTVLRYLITLKANQKKIIELFYIFILFILN